METTIFYIFEPTATLRELAVIAGMEVLARRGVWSVRKLGRAGAEYSREELSQAHWAEFAAQLFGPADESQLQIDFRKKCLSLGFEGCWTVSDTKLGGDASELMEEAQSARRFLAERGLNFS